MLWHGTHTFRWKIALPILCEPSSNPDSGSIVGVRGESRCEERGRLNSRNYSKILVGTKELKEVGRQRRGKDNLDASSNATYSPQMFVG